MCGIAGIFMDHSPDRMELQREISVMTSCLEHRGPDDYGYAYDDRVALGHRRLSIIDLAGGKQPIYNEDKTLCIVFNGEIYNYLEMKKDLVASGHRFATNSDTETILHAYEEWGEECVQRLRGMFAFAIWDSERGSLFLVRDRLGKKPLFYARYGNRFVFSSEMKSILADPAFRRTIDEEAVASYFTFSYIPAPLTIYKDIRKLEPGHYLTYRDGEMTIKQYWDISFLPDRTRKEEDIIHEFMELLEESVRIRLMSEVPLGAFLSGGIDSSTVVALMSLAQKEKVNTFTIGFGGETGGFDDERKYARMVADRYATNHREHEVLPECDGLVERIVRAFDEPFADDSTIPSYYVCKAARENVTVALSGLGGDEAFCGYERYLGFDLSRLYNRIPFSIRKRVIQRIADGIPESPSGGYRVNHFKRFVRSATEENSRRYLGFISKLGERDRDNFFAEGGRHYRDAMKAAEDRFLALYGNAKAEDPLNKVFYCDIKTYLPEDILACTDRMSMCHSLEVRVPFLDHKLFEYCATIPPELKIKGFQKKYLLKKGVRNLLPKPVLKHKKQGFVGPMAKWLKTDLKEYTRATLSGKNLSRHDIFNLHTVNGILEEHYSGKETHDTLIWSLIMFQSWYDSYINPQ
jgi:asparagine synthase (glutamine-hydrolysing)